MEIITKNIFKDLYRPAKDSHKGQNGKLTIIGGSHLFHGASLWALKTASRMVDMVFYSTVEENEALKQKLKSELYDFICVPRDKIGDYIQESDAVLIGPGLERRPETTELTHNLLNKFPNKKWIIDAGSLQMMERNWLKKLTNVVITPHLKEFFQLFSLKVPSFPSDSEGSAGRQNSKFPDEKAEIVSRMAREYGCTIVLKGQIDIICSPKTCLLNKTGNEGMTKGGTGDVLAGLIAALSCKNDLFQAACAGTYVNGLAGDKLYKKIGPFFNASDLCEEIPVVLKELYGY